MEIIGYTTGLLMAAAATADPIPIQCIVDIHCDPMTAVGVEIQEEQYLEWVTWVDWGLESAQDVGGKISFLSTGEFMEWVLDMPEVVEDIDLITRLVASGDNFLGTHSHKRYRVAEHAWQNLGSNPTDAQIEAHWVDHLMTVNMVIQAQLGLSDAAQIQAVNCVRGAHLPSESDEAYFQQLAVMYHFPIRQQGPDEAFYSFFEHFAWHPFRPSTDNLLVHNPDGPMIVSPFGPVLGRVGFHHGILQDMSDQAVQGRFMMELLNWLDEAFFGDQPHVWSTGWSAHCHDLVPGGESHDQWAGMFEWMAQHFVDEHVSGMQVVEFSTMKASAALHEQWEADFPGVVPFSYAEEDTDMDAYPWLRAVYTYLLGLHVDAAMPPQGIVRWHYLVEPDGDREAYVLWTRTGDEVVVDLSAFLDSSIDWIAVEPHRGHYRFIDSTDVPVRAAGTILLPSEDLEQFPWLPDLDENGTIDITDLLAILESWGDCPVLPETCHADLNGDGIVAIDDLLQLLDNWD